jgi:hypothetical protein
MPLHGEHMHPLVEVGAARPICGPMRGACGARLTMARRRANGRARPARPAASHGVRMSRHGGACHVAHARGSAPWPMRPMRGPCGARLAQARCGPTGRVIPAARAPRLGPAACGGAHASNAAFWELVGLCLGPSLPVGHETPSLLLTRLGWGCETTLKFTNGRLPLRLLQATAADQAPARVVAVTIVYGSEKYTHAAHDVDA